ncbi:MAG: hypothetical protein DELT_00231 [Desulfovibrio sp.]
MAFEESSQVHFAAESLMAKVGIALWELDVSEGLTVLSPLLQKRTGLPERMLFDDFREAFVAGDDAIDTSAAFSAWLAEGNADLPLLFRSRDSAGETVWIREHIAVLERDMGGKPARVGGVVQDVTAIKYTGDKIRAENAQRERVAHQAGLGGWEWSAVEDWVRFNDGYREILGQEAAAINGPFTEVCARLVHPDDVERIRDRFRDYITKPLGMFSEEVRLRHLNGHWVWLQLTGSAVSWDGAGRATRVVGGVLDIDARVRAEAQLKESLRDVSGCAERLEDEMAKARALHVAMFDANPHVMMLFDEEGTPVECNPGAVDIFGFSSKAELLQEFRERIMEWTPEFQPSGRMSLSFAENLRLTMETGYNAFETDLIVRGQRISFDIICKRIAYQGAYAMVAYITDLSRMRKAQESLHKQDRLMQALYSTASLLVGMEPAGFPEGIRKAMQRISESVEADRMRVWRNYEEDDELCSREVYAWSGVNFPYAGYYDDMRYASLPYWREAMLERKVINAYSVLLPPAEKHTLQSQNVLAILVVPIYIKDAFWGFVGFDDCTRQHTFTDAEERLLQSAGNMIVAAILRNEMTESLIQRLP